MKQVECPQEPLIIQFARGLLPEAEAESIIDHAETCAECSATIEAHSRKGDGVIDHLREASSMELPQDPACDWMMAKLKQIDLSHVMDGSAGNTVPDIKQIRDYQIVGRLGEGGMGVVFKAVHTRMDRTVALKVLSHRHISRSDRVKRFEREIKAISKLEHPNIVRATDAGEEDRIPFLVMEYVDGEDLSAIVKQDGPLPVAKACEVIHQAATGLQFAHDRGLIHRDIKPSNVMLERTAGDEVGEEVPTVVKILDLGLARAVHEPDPVPNEDHSTSDHLSSAELTRDGLILGTADYMAPEQALAGSDANEQSDIYSLGCTFYFLLSGRAPFRDEVKSSTLETLIRHQRDPLQPLNEIRDDVPAEVEAVVLQMMAKQPSDRFATMSEVATALAATTQPSPHNRVKTNPAPASARSRVTRFVAAGLLIGLLGGAAFYGIQSVKLPTENGTLEVQFDTDEFKAEVGHETIILKSLDTGKSQEFKLSARKTFLPVPPGKYEIVVATNSGLEFVGGPTVTIKTGKTQPILAQFVSEKPTATATAANHRRAAERILERNGKVTVRPRGKPSRDVTTKPALPALPFDIEAVYAEGKQFTNADAALLRGLTSIRRLDLRHTSVTDQALSQFEGLRNCEVLVMTDNKFTPAGVARLLSVFPRLSRVSFLHMELGPDAIHQVAKCEALSLLILPESIKAIDLAPLESVPQKFDLELRCPVNDTDLKHLSRLPLNGLVLNGTGLKGTGLKELAAINTLQSLTLQSASDVAPDGYVSLESIQSLRVLGLGQCDITADQLEAIGRLKQLTLLYIRGGRLERSDLHHLKPLQNLGGIGISETGLTPEDQPALRKILPKCGQVTIEA